MKSNNTNLTVISILLVLVCSSLFAQESIEGVWEINRIVKDHEATDNKNPQPSLIIFTPKHYSIIWIPSDSSMRAFETRWTPTDAEKIHRFGEIRVNTGVYEIEGTQIKVTPIIARMPEFIGGLMIYEYKWSGKELILTLVDEYSYDGVQNPWVKASGGQTHLTLTRISD